MTHTTKLSKADIKFLRDEIKDRERQIEALRSAIDSFKEKIEEAGGQS